MEREGKGGLIANGGSWNAGAASSANSSFVQRGRDIRTRTMRRDARRSRRMVLCDGVSFIICGLRVGGFELQYLRSFLRRQWSFSRSYLPSA